MLLFLPQQWCFFAWNLWWEDSLPLCQWWTAAITWFEAHGRNKEGFLPFLQVQLLLLPLSQPQISFASLLFPQIVNLCINPKDWILSYWSHSSSWLCFIWERSWGSCRVHFFIPCPQSSSWALGGGPWEKIALLSRASGDSKLQC